MDEDCAETDGGSKIQLTFPYRYIAISGSNVDIPTLRKKYRGSHMHRYIVAALPNDTHN